MGKSTKVINYKKGSALKKYVFNKDYVKYNHKDFPLVLFLAKKYQRFIKSSTIDIQDLFQVGFLGLIKAEETYKPERGKFSSWATLYIKSAMRRELSENGYVMKIPIMATAQKTNTAAKVRGLTRKVLKEDPHYNNKFYDEDYDRLKIELEKLSPIERAVAENTMSITDFAKQNGYVRQTVSKIYKRAVKKLRKAFV